ncbi:hypothetical protein [Photorhabdus khanii]|uniref:antitoxin PaaA2 family protein n=1 Tax=Photorhabdus khanii TaxID=1004150 RepID=UPI001865108A|nr:hypothetical protein [Photorhabdus khanii]
MAAQTSMPADFTTNPETYDARFRAKVQKALDDTHPPVSHQQMMDEAQELINRKLRARS